jgi:hypothetical protein
VGALQKSLPAIPFPLEGTASGTVKAELPASTPGKERPVTAKVDLKAPRLRVRGLPTERLQGTIEYKAKAPDYRFEGDSLGGKFHLDGEFPLDAPRQAAPPQPPPPKEGHFRMEGVQLSRLGEVLGHATALRSLRGTANLELIFRHEGADAWPVGEGRLVIDRLRWDQVEWSDRLQSDIILNRREVRFRNLAGRLADGRLGGQWTYNLEYPDRSWFNLALDQAQAARLLAPWPALSSQMEGPLDARLRGTLGREWSGTGLLALGRGRVFGLTVTEGRIPLDFFFVPQRGRGQLEVRDVTAQAAAGRVTGQASFAWDVGNRLDGTLRFTGLQLQTLLHELGSLNQAGSGRVTGRIGFSGTDLRSLNDLTANVEASFQQTQTMSIPVLSQVAPFIPGLSSSSMFTSGDLRGRLAGGIFRIQRLGLQSSLMQLLVEGTFNTQGRLNLDVTANTGLRVNPSLIGFLARRIPVAGPIPVGLILEASTVLAPRLIHLRVTGTFRSPSIQVEPIALLTQEAVIFFLGRAAGAGL